LSIHGNRSLPPGSVEYKRRKPALNTEIRKRLKRIAKSPAWVSFIWFGAVAGVSLLATPVKFTADTITRAVALDVGRVTFMAMNKVELIMLILLLALTRISGESRRLWAPVSVIALIILAQSIWLLPELAARTDLIIAGTEPGPSIAHAAFSVLELSKLALLAYVGFRATHSLAA
jgi:hypothetical protein